MRINLSRGESLAFTQSIRSLGIRLHLRWLDRYGVWACYVATLDDSRILGMEQIVRAGGRMLLDVRDPAVPPGVLRWEGADVYTVDGLGDTIRLMYDTP